MLFLAFAWAGYGVSLFINAGGYSDHGLDVIILAMTLVAYHFMRKKLYLTVHAFGFMQRMFFDLYDRLSFDDTAQFKKRWSNIDMDGLISEIKKVMNES